MKEESHVSSGDNGITYIEATNADVLSGTKTTIIDDGRVFWNPCDQIGVYFGYNYANYSSCNMEPAQTARFVCKDISLTTGSYEGSGNQFTKKFPCGCGGEIKNLREVINIGG